MTYNTCLYCETEMVPGGSCGVTVLVNGTVPRVPSSDVDNCLDCNAGPGKYHHVGCTEDTCPGCGGVAIDCQLPEVRTGQLMNAGYPEEDADDPTMSRVYVMCTLVDKTPCGTEESRGGVGGNTWLSAQPSWVVEGARQRLREEATYKPYLDLYGERGTMVRGDLDTAVFMVIVDMHLVNTFGVPAYGITDVNIAKLLADRSVKPSDVARAIIRDSKQYVKRVASASRLN